MIGIVIPTVPGRDKELEHAVASHTDPRVVQKIWTGEKTCGEAWVKGAAYLGTSYELEYIMFTADDLIAHSGWLDAALSECAAGYLPAPTLYNEDMTLWQPDGSHGDVVSFPRVPFMPWELWQAMPPMPPLHYYSDCWIGDRAAEMGWQCRIHEEYAFTHTWAQPGRIHTDTVDREAYTKDAGHHLYRDLEARARRKK